MHTEETKAPDTAPTLPPEAVTAPQTPAAKKPRGFAKLAQTPEGKARISEIARKGGKAAHAQGTAHEFSSEEARVAGQKGGKATHAKLRRMKGGE